MGGRGRLRGAAAARAADAWALLLTALLCLPALTHRGYGFAADLVLSPRQPLTWETVGVTGRLPRAVPVDAVVALVESVVPGAVVFRIALLAGPLLAGLGASRLLADRPTGRWVAVTVAVWNPYVVERIALGQWALLLGYGALFWIVLACVSGTAPARIWVWTGVASLTPTGGLLAVATVAVLTLRRAPRAGLLLAGCLLLQAPWAVPSLLRHDTASSGGDSLFAARADGPGGTLVSLIGLGGIWDHLSVPTSRTSLLVVLAAALALVAVLGSMGGGAVAWPRLHLLAGGALLLAAAPVIPGLGGLFDLAVTHLPGGGLLRDSQKWLAPWVLLTAAGAGEATERLLRRAGRRDPAWRPAVAGICLLLPFLLLPDATTVTWRTVTPVEWPADFAAVRSVLAEHPGSGRVALVPPKAYRSPSWSDRRAAHDPAYAWFDVDFVGSTALRTGRGRTGEESPDVADLEAALAAPDRAEALRRMGVGWVLVYADDPDSVELDLTGLEPRHRGPALALWQVPGGVVDVPPSLGVRVLVIATDLTVLVFWIASWAGCVLALARRRSGGSLGGPAADLHRG